MKKIFIAFLAVILCSVISVALVGCSKNSSPAEISYVTDIEFYSAMQRQADKIDVKFDTDNGKYFNFTITDENEMEEIMDILFTEKLNDLGGQLKPPGSNTGITVWQGDKGFGFDVQYNEDNGRLYAFSSRRLADKIRDIAAAHGAYEGI